MEPVRLDMNFTCDMHVNVLYIVIYLYIYIYIYAPTGRCLSVIFRVVGFYLSNCLLPIQMTARGQPLRWLSVVSNRAGELMGRSLASQISVFRYVFDLVLGLVGVDLVRSQITRPESGIFCQVPAIVAPWPHTLNCRVQSILSSHRPFRFTRDFARPWP